MEQTISPAITRFLAAALELKDCLWGGKPDWIDATLTIAGVTIGYAIRVLTLKWL